MAKLPGLFPRDGVFYSRVVIPVELQAAHGGRKKLIRSLDTRDRRAAILKATKLRADTLADFDRMLKEAKPSPVDTISPELSAILSARLYASLMAADDTVRGNPEAAQMLIALDRAAWQRTTASLMIGPDSRTPLPLPAMGTQWDGLSAEQAQELAGINASLDTFSAGLLARQTIGAMLPFLRAEAARLGLTFTDTAPGTKEALRAALRAYRKAMQDRAARDRGDAILTPEGPTLAALPPKRHTMRDAFDRWKASKPRTADTIRACERALILFESQLNNPVLSTLTRSQGDEFRGWLQKQGTASKTARDRLTWVKSLLKYATRELEWLPKNPWEGLDIESTVTNRRRPWTDDQLTALFGLPLFTAYELPTTPKAGADAAYWIPLLGIFTGSRVSELCQLRIADINTESKTPSLSITDEGAGQQLKTSASVRDIPIHSELIRLGFLEYVRATAKAGHDRVFPALPLRAGKPGGYFSDWFGITKPKGLPDFHSFRHLVRSTMAEAGQSEPAMDRVTGHEVRGSEGTRVYTQGTKQALQRSVESIQYPCLMLPVVYLSGCP